MTCSQLPWLKNPKSKKYKSLKCHAKIVVVKYISKLQPLVKAQIKIVK